MIKLDLDIDTTAKESDVEDKRLAELGKSIPPDCSPEEHLDWRFRFAYHLADNTEERPIQHADAWVERAANFVAMLQDGNGSRRPTDVDFAITFGEAGRNFTLDLVSQRVRHIPEVQS